VAKTSSKSKAAQYATYKSSRKWEANRRRKLERTLKAQPNNEQVKQALKNIKYRRRIPVTKMWSHSWKAAAHLIKSIEGRFNPAIMSSNSDAARTALQNNSKLKPSKLQHAAVKNPFSIAARLNLGNA